MSTSVVIIGGRAGAKIVYEVFFLLNYNIIGFIDTYVEENAWENIKPNLLGSLEKEENRKLLSQPSLSYFVATGDNHLRREITINLMKTYHKKPVNAIHPKAVLSQFMQIGHGNLICANAVVNIGTKVGNGTIINTSSIVEHDNIIEDYAQISPNVTLAGYVTVKECAFVASSATIIPKITVNKDSYVAAGAVVIKDVEPNTLVGGCPAKKIKDLP